MSAVGLVAAGCALAVEAVPIPSSAGVDPPRPRDVPSTGRASGAIPSRRRRGLARLPATSGAPHGVLARELRCPALAVSGTSIVVSVAGRNATDTGARVVAAAFGAWFFSRRMPLWLALLVATGGHVGFRRATR